MDNHRMPSLMEQMTNRILEWKKDRLRQRVKSENELFKPENDRLRALLQEVFDAFDKNITAEQFLADRGWFDRVRLYLDQDGKDG